MLLYAKTQEQITPDNEFVMSGNRIVVKTLDLNLPFVLIAEKLEAIVGLSDLGRKGLAWMNER